MPRQNPTPSPNQPPPPGSNPGAWTQHSDGSWTWVPGATPDPNLVKQWGNAALTDPRRDPTGTPAPGAWEYKGRPTGWIWVWGANPDPNLVKQWGKDKLTNPDQTPSGAPLPPDGSDIPGGQPPGIPQGQAGDPGHPPPPDVVPPTVKDIWSGVAPDVTGQLPPPPDGTTPPTVSKPPSHPAYFVSPGSIRDAENRLLAEEDAQISEYNDLKAYVAQTPGQNLYSESMPMETLRNTQDVLLLNIGDSIEVVGQYISMLNYAAQDYAHADIGSFVPDS
jgi:hypothetical protein